MGAPLRLAPGLATAPRSTWCQGAIRSTCKGCHKRAGWCQKVKAAGWDSTVLYIYISEVLNTRRRFLPETIEKLETVTVFRSIDRFECCVYRS